MLSNQHKSKSSKSAFRVAFWEQCITYTSNHKLQIHLTKKNYKSAFEVWGAGGQSYFYIECKTNTSDYKLQIHLTIRNTRVHLKSREQEGRAPGASQLVTGHPPLSKPHYSHHHHRRQIIIIFTTTSP